MSLTTEISIVSAVILTLYIFLLVIMLKMVWTYIIRENNTTKNDTFNNAVYLFAILTTIGRIVQYAILVYESAIKFLV